MLPMELLRTIKSLLKLEATEPLPPISLNAEGFTTSGQFAPWSEIQEISAFKLDRLTTDEVRFTFTLNSGVTILASEEQPGFPELVVALERHFPSVAGWQSRVIPPAFKANSSVLYRRT